MDRTRHDASVRHQSQLQAFIRGLHKQNRDTDREARLAAAAVKELEAAVAESNGTTTEPASTTQKGPNSAVIPTARVIKPIKVASVSSATAADPSVKKTLLFEKKKHAKKVDTDTANWKFEEKNIASDVIKTSTTTVSSVAFDLLGDSNDKDAPPKPKALFKKRQIRVSK